MIEEGKGFYCLKILQEMCLLLWTFNSRSISLTSGLVIFKKMIFHHFKISIKIIQLIGSERTKTLRFNPLL